MRNSVSGMTSVCVYSKRSTINRTRCCSCALLTLLADTTTAAAYSIYWSVHSAVVHRQTRLGECCCAIFFAGSTRMEMQPHKATLSRNVVSACTHCWTQAVACTTSSLTYHLYSGACFYSQVEHTENNASIDQPHSRGTLRVCHSHRDAAHQHTAALIAHPPPHRTRLTAHTPHTFNMSTIHEDSDMYTDSIHSFAATAQAAAQYVTCGDVITTDTDVLM